MSLVTQWYLRIPLFCWKYDFFIRSFHRCPFGSVWIMTRFSMAWVLFFLLFEMASGLVMVDPMMMRNVDRQPPLPTGLSSLPATKIDPSISRRSLVGRFFLIAGLSSVMSLGFPPRVVAEDDPFAQMDSFASSLGAPQQSSTAAATTTARPSPTTNVQDYNTKEGVKQSELSEASFSALDAALEESRKRKRIDPRTHG